MNFRIATNKDRDQINCIADACNSDPNNIQPIFRFDETESIEATKNKITFVAEDGGQILGWVSLESSYSLYQKDYSDIVPIAVHPKNRRKRVGAFMIDNLIQWVKLKTIQTKLEAGFQGVNIPSISLFKKMGFERIEPIFQTKSNGFKMRKSINR